MDSDSRITWIMPILNGMPYLPDTLQAIADTSTQSARLLVWDNGSTDGSVKELSKWIPNRIPGEIFQGTHYGVGGSLRELVKRVDTEFCSRIDADDIPLPGRLEKQEAFLNANPDVAVVGGQMESMNEYGTRGADLCDYPITHSNILARMLAGQNPIPHPAVMFRTQAILDVGNYLDLPNVEDYELWMRVAIKHRLANLPDTLTRYRIHSRSVTRIAIIEKNLQDLVNQTLTLHSGALFGWPSGSMKSFIQSELTPLLDEAIKLSVPTWRRCDPPPLKVPEFIDLFLKRTAVNDFSSLFAIALLDPRKGSLLLALKCFIKKLIRHPR
jgi:hypothetical protein